MTPVHEAQAAENLSPLTFKDLRYEQLVWQVQDGGKVELTQAAGSVLCSMSFARPSAPAWNAHLAVEDWSGQGTRA